jgi:uncharacterized Tic20 family protein
MTTRQESEIERRRTLTRRGVAVAGQGSERALAAAAHGAIAFGFVGIGFILSLVITAVIWLASKKSPYVREQADRAGRYQIFVLLVNIVAVVIWVLGFALLLSLTGWRIFGFGGGDPQVAESLPITVVIALDTIALIAALPLFAVWFYGTIFYGVYGTIRALAGHDFHYPPPPWKRRKRQVQPVAEDPGDDEPDDDLPEDDVRDEVLERKLKWEK